LKTSGTVYLIAVRRRAACADIHLYLHYYIKSAYQAQEDFLSIFNIAFGKHDQWGKKSNRRGIICVSVFHFLYNYRKI